MKRRLYLIGILILVLAITVACTQDEDKLDKADKDEVVDIEEDIDEEDELEDSEDIAIVFEDKINISLEEAGDFIEKNMDKLNSIEVDQMISKLIDETEEAIGSRKRRIEQLDEDQELSSSLGEELFFDEEEIKNIENEGLREELESLMADKYRLINLEGEYYPIVNYEAFKRYDAHVSDEVRDYIDLKARDAKEPVAIDGALYIDYDELADRIVETENYIKKYGQGDRYEETINMYRNKLNLYLLGLPNTPITELDSERIREDLLKSYNDTELIKDSLTGFIVGKYRNVILAKEGIVDDEVRGKAELLLEEAIELMGMGK